MAGSRRQSGATDHHRCRSFGRVSRQCLEHWRRRPVHHGGPSGHLGGVGDLWDDRPLDFAADDPRRCAGGHGLRCHSGVSQDPAQRQRNPDFADADLRLRAVDLLSDPRAVEGPDGHGFPPDPVVLGSGSSTHRHSRHHRASGRTNCHHRGVDRLVHHDPFGVRLPDARRRRRAPRRPLWWVLGKQDDLAGVAGQRWSGRPGRGARSRRSVPAHGARLSDQLRFHRDHRGISGPLEPAGGGHCRHRHGDHLCGWGSGADHHRAAQCRDGHFPGDGAVLPARRGHSGALPHSAGDQ